LILSFAPRIAAFKLITGNHTNLVPGNTALPVTVYVHENACILPSQGHSSSKAFLILSSLSPIELKPIIIKDLYDMFKRT
jgi:hypothetical protein